MFEKVQGKAARLLRRWTKAGKLLFALAVFVFTTGFIKPASGQPATELYNAANQLYKKNLFDSAAAGYEKILMQGYKTPEVYYNLGNCYYKLNSLGKAILNYERALKLAPQDEDIQHNLKIADTRVVDKIVPVPQLGIIVIWNNFVSMRTAKGWAIWAIALVWVALLFFAVYLFMGLRKISFSLGFILVVFSVFVILLASAQNQKEQATDSAVLMVPNSFVKSAPDNNGNDLFMLHEGIKFAILDHVGEWNKIRLADGKVGWVERSSFEKI